MSGRIIKIAVTTVIIAIIAIVSIQKINSNVLSDFDVVSHYSIYEKNGFPVYSAKTAQPSETYFITDIAFVKDNSANARMYTAYVDDDKRKALKVGYEVFVPKEQDTLRKGFNRQNPHQYFMGKISSISSSRDWQTGLYRVNILMDTVLPQAPFYSAKAVVEIMKNIVVAPIANLENTNNTYYAWTIDSENKARRNELRTGICDGYNCQIISGLNAGELMITSDLKELKDGMLLNNRGTH